ncbi:MAG TPA: Gfo/Idh/MocA family oxidoreductase [Gemmatimonadaceae bacterium]|nr:Gfo/Idh/MocA family oxidoreductase [Gemmatimonadaceae bacterium]
MNPISKLTPSRWMEAIKSTSPRTVSTGPIRVAVIGCGTVAQTAHLPLLRRLGDFAIVGVADTDPAMLAAAALIAKRARQTVDYRELLTPWMADAVVISLPTVMHAEAARAAFEGGLHVYLEKPIATDLREAMPVLDAWRASRRVGMIGHNYRFNPLYRKLREMIAGGRIGAPRDARMAFTAPVNMGSWRDVRAAGGGALLDLGTHEIDLARYLFDSEVAFVTAKIESRRAEHDWAELVLELENDVFIKVTLGLGEAFADRMQVIGETGSLFVDRAESLDVEYTPAAGTPLSSGEFASLLPSPRAKAAHLYAKLRAPFNEPSFRLSLRAFGEAITMGRSASPDLDDGYAALKVIAAAELSSSLGRRVAISEVGEAQGLPEAT